MNPLPELDLRTRLKSAQVVVLGLRDEVREALRERDEWAERCRARDATIADLRARLAAAARASASIPAPAPGPWSEPDVAGWLDGYASADDARAAGHQIPAVMTDPASAISWLCSGCGGAIGGCGYCLSSGVVCYDCADRAGVQFAPVSLSTVTGAEPSLHLPAAAGPAANGQPSPPDSTAPAGSGADPSPERGRAVPAPSRPGAWILPRVTR